MHSVTTETVVSATLVLKDQGQHWFFSVYIYYFFKKLLFNI